MAPPAQILIVEDKDSLRTMLRHALERQGHGVLEATNQPEAVRVLLQHQPALVLSDLRLPEGDGFGVLRAAKELDLDIPVIVMTAYGSIEDAVPFWQAKVREHKRGLGVLQLLHSLRLVARLHDLMALALQGVAQHGAERVLVLDDENASGGGHAGGA